MSDTLADGISSRGWRGRLTRFAEKRLPYGRLTLVWPDGARNRLQAGAPGPDITMNIRRWPAVRRMLTGGSIGLAESYIRGDWDCDNLTALIEVAGHHRRHGHASPRTDYVRRGLDKLRHRLRDNTRQGSRRNIAAHYDLGNEFYAAWLDASMTYSSAIFTERTNSLASAQDEKCRRLLALIDPKPGERVLEIGCGWGHFAVKAASERGAKVTGLTLSRKQHDYARQRIQKEGLGDFINIVLCDYRDIKGQYDHVASIEMIEAVGEKYWPAYFQTIQRVLRPGGRAGIQAITIADDLFDEYRQGVDFIQKYIFPGGLLPSSRALKAETDAVGLGWRDDQGYGASYARTLATWRDRFLAAWPRIAPLGFDEQFRRMWTLYLSYCEGLFNTGSIDVRQIALSRP